MNNIFSGNIIFFLLLFLTYCSADNIRTIKFNSQTFNEWGFYNQHIIWPVFAISMILCTCAPLRVTNILLLFMLPICIILTFGEAYITINDTTRTIGITTKFI